MFNFNMSCFGANVLKMYFAACLYCVLCVLAWRLCLCGGKRTS